MPGLARLGAQRQDIEAAAAQVKDDPLQYVGIGYEARGRMAAIW